MSTQPYTLKQLSIEQAIIKSFNAVPSEYMYLKEYMEQINEVVHASQDDECCCHGPI